MKAQDALRLVKNLSIFLVARKSMLICSFCDRAPGI